MDFVIQDPTHRAILEAVRRIETRKKQANRHPHFALLIGDNLFGQLSTLCSAFEFNEALQELEDWGLIRIGRTINDTYVTEVELGEVDSKLSKPIPDRENGRFCKSE